MQKDGKYIYCIIASNYDCNFGYIGVGGRGDLVTTSVLKDYAWWLATIRSTNSW